MNPRLLIAEDHAAMRAKVESILQRDFDLVSSVGEGLAAVEATLQLMPDVLILDVSMPIVDGPNVARRLRAQGCNAKIVFISVSRDLDQVVSCLEAGGDAYVSKMRIASELISAITNVLTGKRFVSSDIALV